MLERIRQLVRDRLHLMGKLNFIYNFKLDLCEIPLRLDVILAALPTCVDIISIEFVCGCIPSGSYGGISKTASSFLLVPATYIQFVTIDFQQKKLKIT